MSILPTDIAAPCVACGTALYSVKFVRTALHKRVRRVGTSHEVEPARSARGSTHQDSIEALTGNRCSSLTFESKGGAELRTRRLRIVRRPPGVQQHDRRA